MVNERPLNFDAMVLTSFWMFWRFPDSLTFRITIPKKYDVFGDVNIVRFFFFFFF